MSHVYKRFVLAARKNPPILTKNGSPESARRILFSKNNYVGVTDEITAYLLKSKYCDLEYVTDTELQLALFTTVYFRKGLNFKLDPSYRGLIRTQFHIFTKTLHPPRSCNFDSAPTQSSVLSMEQMQAAWIVGAVLLLAAFVLFASENLLVFAVSRLRWKKTARISAQFDWEPHQQLSKFHVTSKRSTEAMEDSAVEMFGVPGVVRWLRELPIPQQTVANRRTTGGVLES